MKIISHAKNYEVGILDKISISELKGPNKTIIIVDKNVFRLYKDSYFKGIDKSEIYLFEAVETNKTIDSALKICKRMAELSFKRNDLIISIGGGIVQDVTGFAANIFNRGVKWTFVPTTLLAQCDSCIGGKTSLNYLSYKNILGTFYAPDNIYIDLNFVKTLSEKDYLSGLGEVAKFNIMAAKDGIGLLETNMDKIISRDVSTLRFFLERSLAFKKTFIEEDEFDRGVRNLLNYAHTFGHAFETVSRYAVPHGQAVTLGLIVANDISRSRKILEDGLKERIENLCVKLISVKLNAKWFEPENIISAMKKDKKRRSDKLAAVLFQSDLSLHVVQDVEPQEVESALGSLTTSLKKAGKI
jgi:3-dehydroquinate synthase